LFLIPILLLPQDHGSHQETLLPISIPQNSVLSHKKPEDKVSGS